MTFLTYELKLKTGFFKTEFYDLCIYDDKIVLVSKENTALQEIVITKKDLNSISLINKNSKFFEIEIRTQQGIFIGNLSTSFDSKELLRILVKNFDGKILI